MIKKAFVQGANRITREKSTWFVGARGQEVTKVLSDFIQGQQIERTNGEKAEKRVD